MIAYLQGKVLNKFKQSIVLLCANIGYEVFLPSLQLGLIEEGQDMHLYIYSRIREDEFTLYGFLSTAELDFFKMLISVSGVGPKTAMEILSTDMDKVKSAIVQENAAFLSKVPGIGKKTSERIIVELKNKVFPENPQSSLESALNQQLEEVVAALINLGYQRGEIKRVLDRAPAEIETSEELITFFLKNV